MTMMDEEVLARALRDAASGFEISPIAQDDIVAAAAAPSEPSVLPTVFRPLRRHRAPLLGAAAVIVVVSIALPLWRGEHPARVPSASNGSVQDGQKIFQNGQGPTFTPAHGTTTGSELTLPATGLSVRNSAAISGRRIESTGSVSLVVGKGRVASGFAALGRLATKLGGSVVSSSAVVGTRTSGRFSRGTIVLEVPQAAFATLVERVQTLGHATSVQTSSTDVTSQYVDLRAQITALDASRHQYLAIMTRATTISDILRVQSQLNGLQSQIEQLQGQLNVLGHQTAFATLAVAVSETRPPAPIPTRTGFARAWHDAVAGFVAGVQWIVRLAGPVLFAALLLALLWLAGRVLWRATERRRL